MYTSQICLIETNLKALAVFYNSSMAGLKLLKAAFLKSAFHKNLLKNSAALIIIIGDLIATGLRRYQHTWKNYLKDALNLGISGDRVENGGRGIFLCSMQTCL